MRRAVTWHVDFKDSPKNTCKESQTSGAGILGLPSSMCWEVHKDIPGLPFCFWDTTFRKHWLFLAFLIGNQHWVPIQLGGHRCRLAERTWVSVVCILFLWVWVRRRPASINLSLDSSGAISLASGEELSHLIVALASPKALTHVLDLGLSADLWFRCTSNMKNQKLALSLSWMLRCHCYWAFVWWINLANVASGTGLSAMLSYRLYRYKYTYKCSNLTA